MNSKKADSKKTKRLSKNERRKQLLESIIINEVVESEESAEVIKQYEYIIKAKKKGIISIAYYQRKVSKRFKKKEKFIKLVSQLGIHKSRQRK